MTGTTHLAAGLLLALAAPEQILPITAGIALGSVLPDIDSSSSLVGRYIPVLPQLLKHRGITHAPLIALLLYIWPVTRPIAAGLLLHMAMDLFTPDGIPLLWPLKKRFNVPIINLLFKSDGFGERALQYVLWAIVLIRFAGVAIGVVY